MLIFLPLPLQWTSESQSRGHDMFKKQSVVLNFQTITTNADMDSKIQKPTTTLSETLMLYEFLILQSPGWSYCKDHFRWNVSKVGFGVTVAKHLSCFWAQDDISIGGFGSHLFIPENGQALISSWKNLYCVQTWFQKSHDKFWTHESYFLMNLVIGKEENGLRT